MAKRKTVEQQIAEAMEKIKQEQNALKKLQEKQKEQDTKARNHRLCRRHGFLESILPDLINLTDEQYQKFVKQHIANSHGINALEKIKSQGATITPPKPIEATTQPTNPTTPKPPEATVQPASPAPPKPPETTLQPANPAHAKPPTTATQPTSTAPTKPALSDQNPKPTAPAGATHNGNNPPKHNPQNAGTNSPPQGTPQGNPA